MPADLKSKSSLQRSSVILGPDAVVKLEHAYTQDRVYRCNYDRIQSLIIWSNVPVARLVFAILLGLLSAGGILIALNSNDVGAEISTGIIGGVLFLISVLLIYRYTVYKNTTIRITRGGARLDIIGIYPRRKLQRFRENLLMRVRAAQPSAPAPLPDLPPQNQPLQ